MTSVAALVLAGGQSRRMGQDKALLRLPLEHNPTLLEHICNIATACSDLTYVLTPWPQRYESFLQPSVTLLQEHITGNGPLVALAQGWSMILDDRLQDKKAPPDWLLTLACDTPALDLETLQSWREQLVVIDAAADHAVVKNGGPDKENVSANAAAALAKQSDRWEPLCGFYHRRCIPSLQRAVQHNVRSFQYWLRDETVMQLPLTNFHMLRNCNTPMEWAQFLHATDARNL